jgi:autotransporter-associated beta strand protein
VAEGGSHDKVTKSDKFGPTKTGSGTQELAGDCTFTGFTEVNVGTLVVNTPNPGTPYGSAILVKSGATLRGNAVFAGKLLAGVLAE